jgi:sodium-dependent phosphate transporter
VTGTVQVKDIPEGNQVEDESQEKAVVPVAKAKGFEARLDKLFHQDMIHAAVTNNATVAAIHSSAEAFPIKSEVAFGYLQVFSACFAAFAHGANDVANAIGPYAGIVQVFTLGVGGAAKKSEVPDWILVMGGAGLVIGLGLFGHIIIAAMGVKLVKITPTRGFCVELSTAFVIVLGSYLGLPLSSTQVATGAILGVGLAEGRVRESVNWYFLGRTFVGWVLTVRFVCFCWRFCWDKRRPG